MFNILLGILMCYLCKDMGKFPPRIFEHSFWRFGWLGKTKKKFLPRRTTSCVSQGGCKWHGGKMSIFSNFSVVHIFSCFLCIVSKTDYGAFTLLLQRRRHVGWHLWSELHFFCFSTLAAEDSLEVSSLVVAAPPCFSTVVRNFSHFLCGKRIRKPSKSLWC